MQYKDYYKILNVDKNANIETIEKAYRKLARQYHTDVNPGDKTAEARFKEISEAHTVLGNPDKRAKYDQLSVSWQAALRSGDTPNFDWSQWAIPATLNSTSDLDPASLFSEFFEAVFRGMETHQPQGAPIRGQDYHQTVEISMEEAFKGAARVLRIGGRRIEVRIPRGAQSGTKIRVRNQGGKGRDSGDNGDLYLDISVTPDPTFERVDNDIYTDLPIDLYTAVLGGEATVPTFRGRIKLRIAPETQSGRTFRLREQGMPHLKKPEERGDLYVKIMITLPENLSDEELALFEELADLRGM